MANTKKFSEFLQGGNLDTSDITVGYKDGVNIQYVTPWAFLPPGSLDDRPEPSEQMFFKLRHNTTTHNYEHYNAFTHEWVFVETSGDISNLIARLASHTVNNGASMIGLLDQTGVASKTVQDLANASIIAQTDNGTLTNGQFLSALATGILKNATTTGVVSISAPLTSIDGLTTAADKMIYTTAPDTYAVTDLSPLARTLLADTTAEQMRTTIGVGDPTDPVFDNLIVLEGTCLGFNGTPVNKVVQIGDANFNLTNTTGLSPIITFDEFDQLSYVRSLNKFIFSVSATILFSICPERVRIRTPSVESFAAKTNHVAPANVNAISYNTNLLSLDYLNGRVGIGNTAPTAKLEVTGQILASQSDGGERLILLNAQNSGTGAGSSGALRLASAANSQSIIENVFVGTGSNRLDISVSRTNGTLNNAIQILNASGALTTTIIGDFATTGSANLGNGSGVFKINSSTPNINTILDEDNMASNSDTALATQQSIKAYVDNATGVGSFTAGSVIFAGSGGALTQDNANLFWNNSTKRLGIGNAAPTAELDLTGNFKLSGNDRSILVGDGGLAILQLVDSAVEHIDDGMYYTTSQTKGHVFVTAGGIERARITSVGLGIGITTVNVPLQFANTTGRKISLFEIANNDHQYYGFAIGSNQLIYQTDDTASSHIFRASTSDSASAELMRIQGNGKVGIGSGGSVARGLLKLQGPASSINGPVMEFFNDNDGTHPMIQILPWATNNISIALDAVFDGASWFSSSANSNFRIFKDTSDLEIQANGPTAVGGTFTWNTRFRVNVAGEITIGNRLNLISSANVQNFVNFQAEKVSLTEGANNDDIFINFNRIGGATGLFGTVVFETPTISSQAISGFAFRGQGVMIGAPTGGNKGSGTLNVAGDIYKNNSAYTNPDYVLEAWQHGKIERFIENEGAKDYELKSLEDYEKHMRSELRLPGITNDPMGAFKRQDFVLEKLEEAFIYIIELKSQLESLKNEQYTNNDSKINRGKK